MLVLVLAVVLLVAAIAVRIFTESRQNYPPGPFSFPFLGTVQQGRLLHTIAHEETEKWGRQYGDLIFFRLLFDEPLLVVRGYDLIKEATRELSFLGVGRALTFREHGVGRLRGLIFAEGHTWHEMRRFAVRTLHEEGFGRAHRSDNINDELENVLQHLEAAADTRGEVQPRFLFTAAAANSLMQLVVGQKLPRDERLERLTELVERNTTTLGPAYLHLDLFPWLRHVAPERSGYKEFREDLHELLTLFQPLLDEQKAAAEKEGSRGHSEAHHLLEAFVQQQRQEQRRLRELQQNGNQNGQQNGKHHPSDVTEEGDFNDDNLRGMLKDLFMAGMGTASTAMEWVLLVLVTRPEVQSRAAAEVLDVIGTERRPAIGDMTRTPYLTAVLEETYRCWPVVPIAQHATTFGATRLGGYNIPANCRVLFDFHSVNYDAEFWGDPETFRPERFLGPDADRLRRRMAAFGMGRRACIGETHARQSVFLFTAGLLQRLRLRLCPGQGDHLDRPEPDLIVKPQNFRFSVERRRTA